MVKQIFRHILSSVLALAVAASAFTLPAAAENTLVSLTLNSREQFVSSGTTEDGLFPDFQQLFPGETRSQAIRLTNQVGDPASFWLRMEVADQDELMANQMDLVYDLLYGKLPESSVEEPEDGTDGDQETPPAEPQPRQLMTLTISTGNAVLYQGPLGGNLVTRADFDGEEIPAAGTAVTGLIELGSLKDDHFVDLTATLTVDPSMGNEYADLLANITWYLEARWDRYYPPKPPEPSDSGEEIPDESTPTTSVPGDGGGTVYPGGPGDGGEGVEEIPDETTPLNPFPDQQPVPQTGDTFPVELLAIGALCFVLVAMLVVIFGRKRKNR